MSAHSVRSLTPEEAEKIRSAVAGAVDDTLTTVERIRMAKSRVALIRDELAQAEIDLVRMERHQKSPISEDDVSTGGAVWQRRAGAPCFLFVGCQHAVEDPSFHEAHLYIANDNTYRCNGVYL